MVDRRSFLKGAGAVAAAEPSAARVMNEQLLSRWAERLGLIDRWAERKSNRSSRYW